MQRVTMDRPFFYRYLALVARLDLSAAKELEQMADGSDRPTCYQRIGAALKAGHELGDVMRQSPGTFPAAQAAVVSAAACGRVFADVLDELHLVERRGRGALLLLWPTALYLCLMTLGIALYGSTSAYLSQILLDTTWSRSETLRSTVPLLSAACVVLQGVSIAAQVALVGTFVAGVLALFVPAFRVWLAARARRLLLRMPLLGPALRDQSTARFLGLLASLLRNGMPADRALGIAAGVLDAPGPARAVAAARHLGGGRRLSEALAAAGLLSGHDAWRLELGEDAGSVLERLELMSRDLEWRWTVGSERFRRVVEPMVTAVAGAMAAAFIGTTFWVLFSVTTQATLEVLK